MTVARFVMFLYLPPEYETWKQFVRVLIAHPQSPPYDLGSPKPNALEIYFVYQKGLNLYSSPFMRNPSFSNSTSLFSVLLFSDAAEIMKQNTSRLLTNLELILFISVHLYPWISRTTSAFDCLTYFDFRLLLCHDCCDFNETSKNEEFNIHFECHSPGVSPIAAQDKSEQFSHSPRFQSVSSAWATDVQNGATRLIVWKAIPNTVTVRAIVLNKVPSGHLHIFKILVEMFSKYLHVLWLIPLSFLIRFENVNRHARFQVFRGIGTLISNFNWTFARATRRFD